MRFHFFESLPIELKKNTCIKSKVKQTFRRPCFKNSRSESYSVLSPFLSKLIYAYRRNRKKMSYLLVYLKIESEIAVKSYKQYFLFYLQNSIFC